MRVRCAVLQSSLCPSIGSNLSNAEKLVDEAVENGALLISLPEYFFCPPRIFPLEKFYRETRPKVENFLRKTSKKHGIIISSNLIEFKEGKYYNESLIFDSGKIIGKQRKVNLTPNERKWGLSSGRKFQTYQSRAGNLGSLICADVLSQSACQKLSGADIVFNPVVSIRRKKDFMKVGRIAMFIARAYDNRYFILKTGSVGEHPFTDIVGRSMVVAPWGILASAKDERGEEVIVADLDLEILRKLRR